jgi:cyclopropane-fatty-acyl-phospholipid synthase
VSSSILVGTLQHERLEPVAHRFRYPVYLYALDLDELPLLDRAVRGFGHNRLRPVAIHDRDYLGREPGTLRERLSRVLRRAGIEEEFVRVVLVTSARYFHYVFNPVSFYFCYGAERGLRCLVAEVSNTFGERHVYVLDDLRRRDGLFEPARPTAKAFHVSPFFDMAGEYRFRFTDPRESFDMRIELVRGGRAAFRARVTCEASPLNSAGLRRTLVRYPFTAALTLPRILIQAARLYFGRRLRVHEKPVPASPWTIRVPGASALERLATRPVLRALRSVKRGSLEVTRPGGGRLVCGEAPGPDAPAPAAHLEIRDPGFFTRVALGGDIGLGESFERGEWSTPDLPELLMLLAANRRELEAGVGALSNLARPFEWLGHALRRNSRRQSRRNIRAHYDFGNEFYGLFLDPTLTYSCARFDGQEIPLQQAQERKLDLVLEKSRAGAGSRVLEIGSGWGSLAVRAARSAGCRVLGITLSPAQLELSRQRAREAGLEDQVEFQLQDYRDVTGTYDAVVSIEMLEAVGHENLGTFFRVCDRILVPGGKVVLQVIVIVEERYEEYRRRPDWIQKYIFPGGHLPSVEAMRQAIARHSTLAIESLERFGADYARTLRTWRERLTARKDEARRLGCPDACLRRWEYYFGYCEAGFRIGEIDVVQMVLKRPDGTALPSDEGGG